MMRRLAISFYKLHRVRRYAVQVLLLLALVTACIPLSETAAPGQVTGSPQNQTLPVPTTAPTTAGPLEPTTGQTPQPADQAAVEPTAPPFPSLVEGELPVGSQEFLLPLTVRHLGEDRAVLFFELAEPGSGYLLYQKIQPETAQTRTVPLSPGEARQQILLEDLQPGAVYMVAVGLGDEDALQQPAFRGEHWGPVRLRTLSGQETVRVGVIGDASFGDPATEALVRLMAGLDLDFVIHTGDVVAEIQDNRDPVEAYAIKFYQTLAPLLHQLPVYTVPGNHDYDAAARWQDSIFYYYAFPPFTDPLFPESPQEGKQQYYAFAVQGIQFMMLDTQVIFGQPGREAQEAWMAERLADERFHHTIPVFHVPPFFSGSVHPNDQLPVRASWHPDFAAARVPLAISGHSHHYERLQVDGITYIVSGGGSGILYAAGEILPESQIYARRTHFVLLEITPGRIDLSAIDIDGEVFDQTFISLQ